MTALTQARRIRKDAQDRDRPSWHQPIPRANIVRENWRTLPLALLTPAEQALYRSEVAIEMHNWVSYGASTGAHGHGKGAQA